MKVLAFIREQIEKRSIAILRFSTGLIYIWFGVLKFFPKTSPAETIVSETLYFISFGVLEGRVPVLVLGVLEISIGVAFLLKRLKYAVPLMYFQMLGTVLPLFMFIEKTWELFPLIPSLLGQYIIKNLVFIAAAIILGAEAGGAKLIIDPVVAKRARATEKRRKLQKNLKCNGMFIIYDKYDFYGFKKTYLSKDFCTLFNPH
ncbi:MAG: DoxX family protein [Flavobacterium sp. JAD_PAG50586_2]|nr:MAG: DoxX family protein [Flavobacterium sp. JAD_PAG50586_2]